MKKHLDWKRIGWVISWYALAGIPVIFFGIEGIVFILVGTLAFIGGEIYYHLRFKESALSIFFYHNGEEAK